MNQELNSATDVNHGFVPALAAPTYYQILNVSSGASRLMIRESYLRLKNLFQGPGDGLYGIGSADDVQRQAAELEEAFAVLNDESRRSDYDHSIAVLTPPESNQPHYGQMAAFNEPPPTSFSETIQTSRSTLKVIKTRANRSSDPEVQGKFEALMAEADLGDGAVLLKLRQMVNVSDVEIHERTKISLDYIKAMETNRFDRLPQVVYVKGFMRSYLKYLCVPNSDKILTGFAARLEAWQQGAKQ
ncbi:MAG: helix-turn-helix domain-containing protein [Proteobacteria bacterium]|nr:helix-turn-helix domain-containing protein [Pseudomonadota bacterium]